MTTARDGQVAGRPDSAARPASAPTSMRDALQRVVVPELRRRGFSGKLPHLRRLTPDATHTFTVQTSKWGGEFIVELGRAAAGPVRTAGGEDVRPEVLTSYHLPDADRARLRRRSGRREVWFRYTPTGVDRFWAMVRRWLGDHRDAGNPFLRAAREVSAKLDECERWWAGENGLVFIRSYAESFAEQGGAARPTTPPGDHGDERNTAV